MTANAFLNRPDPPTEADLAGALGDAQAVWNDLLRHLTSTQIAHGGGWKCHSPKWGWSFRLMKRKRTIVWLSPGRGAFDALFILGDKAVAAARRTALPAAVTAALATAPKYPEGTGLRLRITSARSLPALRKLAALKAAN
ncbi:MAG: hypothetical protein C0518_07425 [Opitutus sp.]|nr:hypothetical protein [Opitutus sp.]